MKKIRIIAIILTIIGLISIITIYTRRNIDYSKTIRISLNEYLSKDNTTELNPIKKLLNSFFYDKNERKTINNYIYKEVGERMQLIDNSYTCDVTNIQECKLLIKELNNYNDKIKKLNNEETNKGYKLLLDNDYENINEEINKRVVGVQKIIDTNEEI